MVTLRPHQADCISKIKSAIASGKRRFYAVSPTGSGKTVTFSALAKQLGSRRTLVLAHREELLKQAQEKLIDAGLTAELEQANNRASDNCQVVVASVQTLNSSERIYKFSHDEFDLIIIDESHHGVCKSYVSIVSYFPQAIVIGFTATPYRADDIDLREVFSDGMVYSLSKEELTRRGFLVPVQRVTRVVPSLSAKHVYEAYQALANNQKTLVFCQGIDHSIEVSDYFNSSGIKTSCVHGGIDKEQRAETLRQFKHNGVKVLTSVGILTEGYDEPSVQCVILARNTDSRVLYDQIVGRGLRLFEGKTHLKVIELALPPKVMHPRPRALRPVYSPYRSQPAISPFWSFLGIVLLIGLIVGLVVSIQHCRQELQNVEVMQMISQEIKSNKIVKVTKKPKRAKHGKRRHRSRTKNSKPKLHVERSLETSF